MSNGFFRNKMNDDEFNYNKSYVNGEIIKETVVEEKKGKKKHTPLRSLTKTVAAAAIFGLVVGAAFQGYYSLAGNQSSKEKTDSSSLEELKENSLLEVGTSQSTSGDVSEIVENVMPSIVAIKTVVANRATDIFGRQYRQEEVGSGSGIIIAQNSNEILIVTNNHVISDARTVEIVFNDNSTATATVKGSIESKDLAVLSVKIADLKEGTTDNIKIATLGNSDSLKLGEMAIAIGNALGYGQSITVGYISALDREVTVNDVTLHVLQTDAAINPGNSGGALLNSKGEVIGINSVKYVDEDVESIGYAIPISEAIPVINELMNRTILAEREKAYLGIGGKDVTEEYSQRFNLPVGVYVTEVQSGSAADKAGIKKGDVIVSINDITVKDRSDIEEILDYTKAGSSGTIGIKTLENDSYVDKTLNITFDRRPSR